MITEKELAILRACLQFAVEELGPHCPDSFLGYLPDQKVETSELAALAQKLRIAKLMYLAAESLPTTVAESKEAKEGNSSKHILTIFVIDGAF